MCIRDSPHSGNITRQKKLLGGPCRGRDVKFNTSCSPGQEYALTAAPQQQQEIHAVVGFIPWNDGHNLVTEVTRFRCNIGYQDQFDKAYPPLRFCYEMSPGNG